MTTAPTRELMLEYEQRAEHAYAAMYEAPSHGQKDLKDDALFFLARAIEVAGALGFTQDAARLRARSDTIMGVYNSQFRGNFR
ncbi:MAG: hypothetical protein ISS15_11600 [Alphaproteobacteria bacterium]|nr:hypothetical protein [Alphaproteobacteria bacterium]MBL7098296.1 hypothetical protein [Alphaproteobacteria bacterium]